MSSESGFSIAFHVSILILLVDWNKFWLFSLGN